MTRTRQTTIGVGLALGIALAWATLHIYAVFFHPLEGLGWLAAPFIIAAMCWLNVGLFIVAHDAMHGSLAPGRPKLNLWAGRTALALYAGFSYDRMLPKHFEHHRRPGSPEDPDFDADHPRHFWRWYWTFLRRYFGLREWAVLAAVSVLYLLLFGAALPNVLLLWALPAILSSLQLFYYGTYRPHRHEEEPFADWHATRSSSYNWLVSLLTCFHFGYHHEHHRSPGTPWWRLPAERSKGLKPALPR